MDFPTRGGNSKFRPIPVRPCQKGFSDPSPWGESTSNKAQGRRVKNSGKSLSLFGKREVLDKASHPHFKKCFVREQDLPDLRAGRFSPRDDIGPLPTSERSKAYSQFSLGCLMPIGLRGKNRRVPAALNT